MFVCKFLFIRHFIRYFIRYFWVSIIAFFAIGGVLLCQYMHLLYCNEDKYKILHLFVVRYIFLPYSTNYTMMLRNYRFNPSSKSAIYSVGIVLRTLGIF